MFIFCLMNFSNWISLECIFSVELSTILYSFLYNLQDLRYDPPGPSYTVVTEETVDEVEKYFSENPNSTIRKVAQVLKISKSSLHRIVKIFLKLHPYKITTDQLLTTKYMEARVKFCKTIKEMFESDEIDENKIVFSDETHFWLNGYVNKQNYPVRIRVRVRKIPIFPYQNIFCKLMGSFVRKNNLPIFLRFNGHWE